MNKKLAESLTLALANSFEMYSRAHGMHWNVEGMFFPTYHKFFGDIYEEIYKSIDAFAEEIRAQGSYVPYGSEKLFSLNTLPESKNHMGSAVKEMLTELRLCNAIVLESLYSSFDLAERDNAQGLMDFVAARIDAHKKHEWMISSCLK